MLNGIVNLLKKIFNKKVQIGVVDIEKKEVVNVEKNIGNEFRNILKLKSITYEKKKKIKTLICVGDGLGIQNKISY